MNHSCAEPDYLTIKEFANLVGMTTNTLRHYDRKGIFHPAKHGDEHFEQKYRYYIPTQITAVKMVRILAEIGVPLQTIKTLAQHRTPEMLIKLLYKQRELTADKIRLQQEVYSVISTFLELLIAGISATESDIYVSEMPERSIILGEVNDFTESAGYARAFTTFCNTLHEPSLNLSYPIGGFFESMEAQLSEPSRPTRFFSLDPRGRQRKLAGLYLMGYTRGNYGETGGLPEKMAAFAKKNGLVFDGHVYNIYLFDEISVVSPDQYLLQISAAVKEGKYASSFRPSYHL